MVGWPEGWVGGGRTDMWMDEWTKARKSRGRTGECTRARKEEQPGDEASRRRRARGRRESWGRGQGARSFPCQQRAPRRPVGLPQFPLRESLRSAPEGWSALARWGRLGRGRRGPEVAGRGRRGPGRSRSPARPRPGEAAGPGPRLRGGRRAAAPGAAEQQPRSQVSAEGRGPGAQVQRARGTRGGPARSCGRGGHPPRPPVPPWSHCHSGPRPSRTRSASAPVSGRWGWRPPPRSPGRRTLHVGALGHR